MNKKSYLILLSLVIATSLILLTAISLHADTSPVIAAEQTWYGAWQPGPDLDGSLVGCAASDGLARHTGVYYQGTTTKRIYFLGGRCENDATTGAVFYFDMASRTYGLTGATMPTPVSNYQVVTVPNDGSGNGPGFYIIGGRTATGANTSVVQVYYPNTNTTDTITTDPMPPTGDPRAPGGVVYANGYIYLFGGFDGTNMDNQTFRYNPQAPEGERWENIHKPLPTARSYIATVVVGDLIYAIGGDEFDGAGLVPLNDTLVLDTNNIGPGWQDDAMADMPVANGDAPAVYVDQGYLGGVNGGIFVIGGYWPSPGPYRWVYRYDIASDTWDSFPSLAIPEPATGRRNQAAVYVPAPGPTGITGLDDGESGIWTFGGFDGSGTNAMTSSSEFLSIEDGPVLVLPETISVISMPGETAIHNFVAVNLSGDTDTYDLSYGSDVPTWITTLPSSVGPVEDGEAGPFVMEVSIPSDATCPTTGEFTVTATSQSNPSISDSQEVTVVASCGVSGVVTDATTGEPIENAYVWIQNSPDGLDEYYDAYTDADGAYLINKLSTGTYYMGASANKHQPTFYPDGWPEGAVIVELAGNAITVDLELVSSRLEWSPGSFAVNVDAGTHVEETLTISNTGTGPLYYFFNVMDEMQPEPPPAADLPVAGLPRIDPLLISKLENAEDGRADFVVILKSQANLQAAYGITDWEERGEYVLNTLRNHATQAQKGVRNMLQNNGASFEPLYIINAVIVRGGNIALVNSLAARPDVAQIVANHSIAVEDPQPSAVTAPDAIEWNIDRVNADDVWNDFGVYGEGIVVAEIDTGTQWDHPALINQYRGWDGSTADHNYNWYDPYGQSPDVPADTHGHGTHVMGTMVGDDGGTNQIGMAPAAKWISCKGGDDVSGYLLTDELLQCAEWIVAPTDLEGNNPDPSMRPHVVNNSWGGGSGDYWFTGVIDAWRAAGVFPQFSNGNEGPSCSTAGSPGDTWNAFSAGASDINDVIASFSSRGPSVNFGYLKPDITAPGVDIRSSVPGGGYEAGWSGTSMASPHVAGAIALLWSANPELIGQIDLSGWLLQQSATPMYTTEGCGGDLPDSHPNNTWGWGLLNVYAAVEMADDASPAWLSVAPLAGEVAPGESLPVTLNFEPGVEQSGLFTATLWLVADDPYNSDVRLPVSMNVTLSSPVPSFDSNSPISVGETAVFTNTTTGAQPISYLWDFGDGITSTLESPTHLYTTSGTYTVTLTVSSPYGEPDPISQDFVVNDLNIYLPLVTKETSPE